MIKLKKQARQSRLDLITPAIEAAAAATTPATTITAIVDCGDHLRVGFEADTWTPAAAAMTSKRGRVDTSQARVIKLRHDRDIATGIKSAIREVFDGYKTITITNGYAVRFARVTGGLGASLETVRAYLPSNYTATEDADGILIRGQDDHGWTLDGYVIPRLASGLIAVAEIQGEPKS